VSWRPFISETPVMKTVTPRGKGRSLDKGARQNGARTHLSGQQARAPLGHRRLIDFWRAQRTVWCRVILLAGWLVSSQLTHPLEQDGQEGESDVEWASHW